MAVAWRRWRRQQLGSGGRSGSLAVVAAGRWRWQQRGNGGGGGSLVAVAAAAAWQRQQQLGGDSSGCSLAVAAAQRWRWQQHGGGGSGSSLAVVAAAAAVQWWRQGQGGLVMVGFSVDAFIDARVDVLLVGHISVQIPTHLGDVNSHNQNKSLYDKRSGYVNPQFGTNSFLEQGLPNFDFFGVYP